MLPLTPPVLVRGTAQALATKPLLALQALTPYSAGQHGDTARGGKHAYGEDSKTEKSDRGCYMTADIVVGQGRSLSLRKTSEAPNHADSWGKSIPGRKQPGPGLRWEV